MADASSVRAKVAQYFVNKKLHELEGLHIKADEANAVVEHALPFGFKPEVPPDSDVLQDQPLLPPIDIDIGRGNAYSWKALLDILSRKRQHHVDLPPWYRVAIIGAGVAGLRTAMLLQDMGIPYEIFEASERAGGRVFTYEFPAKDNQGKHDYYDVGAMRFPKNVANNMTFDLFEELGFSRNSRKSRKLIKYVFSTGDNIRLYNDIKTTQLVAQSAGDHFKDEIVPKEYFYKEWVDLRGDTVYGVNACAAEAYDPLRRALIDDFKQGWSELMKYDWASIRSYLTREKPDYPLTVVHWMENRLSGTGGYDGALSEGILQSFEYNDPSKDVEWWCVEGGGKVLIDAMLETLQRKPVYGQYVTSLRLVDRFPYECFPDQTGSSDQFPFMKFPFMKVSIVGREERYFAHVVSTTTFANLSMIDTDRVSMSYTQRQAIRTLNYAPAVKVAIRFKTRWWEQCGMRQFGGSSYTDRPSRVVVYPSYGLGEDGSGVLIVAYNWFQDASRFGALIQNPEWSAQLDPDRTRPKSEELLLERIYGDLAALHGIELKQLRKDTLDYHAFDWYQNPYTMGAFAHYTPGQYSTFFADIAQPAAHGHFHLAGEVASHYHGWVAGALDSAVRVVDEILFADQPHLLDKFREKYGLSSIFTDVDSAEKQCLKGWFSKELEEAEAKSEKM